jgi:hypothetical protein
MGLRRGGMKQRFLTPPPLAPRPAPTRQVIRKLVAAADADGSRGGRRFPLARRAGKLLAHVAEVLAMEGSLDVALGLEYNHLLRSQLLPVPAYAQRAPPGAIQGALLGGSPQPLPSRAALSPPLRSCCLFNDSPAAAPPPPNAPETELLDLFLGRLSQIIDSKDARAPGGEEAARVVSTVALLLQAQPGTLTPAFRDTVCAFLHVQLPQWLHSHRRVAAASAPRTAHRPPAPSPAQAD